MAYNVHHLNCGSLCMRGARLMHGEGGWFGQAQLACHCLLIETDDGLVLVDTGIGYKDLISPVFPDSYISHRTLGLQPDPEMCAISQIRAMGYLPSEVRHIIVTHLDPDHAGGMMDFPNAQVHLLGKELDAALDPMTWWEKSRYAPYQWKHKPNWVRHRTNGERWWGFDSVQVLSSALYDILLIPLPGHSRGHTGVAVSTRDGWLLHCGDAYFDRREVSPTPAAVPLGIQAIQTMNEICRAERIANQKRLRQLQQMHGAEVRLICSHDATEFAQCCGCAHPLAKLPIIAE